MRSTARLNEIDTYLAKHYTKDGGRACADSLGEKLPYISSRVQHIGLCSTKGGSRKPDAKENAPKIVVLLAKLDAKNSEIAELRDALFKMEKYYSELRVENICLINEKVRAKAGKL